MKLPANLVAALTERKLVLFVGAGFGCASGMPGGDDLARVLAEDTIGSIAGTSDEGRRPDVERSRGDLRKLAQIRADVLRARPTKQWVCDRISAAQKNADAGLAQALAELPCMTVFTTNYDTLIEDAHSPAGDCRMVYRGRDLANLGKAWNVIKLHGHVGDPDSLTLTCDDYDRYEDDPDNQALTEYFRSQLRANTVVVLGSALEDTDLRKHFKGIGEKAGGTKTYVLVRGDDDPRRAEWERYGVRFLTGEIDAFLSEIRTQYETKVATRPELPRVPGTGGDRDCNPFRFFRTDEILTDELDIVARYFTDPFDFPVVLAPGNTIIEGHRGSGKSWILRYMSLDVQARDAFPLPYVGFYVKCKPSAFDSTRRRDEPPDLWRDFFNHYFNIVVVSRIVDAFSSLADRNPGIVPEPVADRIGNYIATYVFRRPSIHRSEGSAAGMLRHLYNEIELLGDDCRSRRHSLRPEDMSSGSVLDRFFEEMRHLLPALFDRGTRAYVLLDEFDNLDQDQQRVLLTRFRDRSATYSFKIAVKLGLMTYQDMTGSFLELGHDYSHVSTDRFDRKVRQEYTDFLRRVANTRLSKEGFQITVDDLLPSRPAGSKGDICKQAADTVRWVGRDFSGFQNYTLLASGITRDFVSLVKDTLYYVFPEIAVRKVALTPVEWKLQNEVIRVKSAVHYRDFSNVTHPEEVKALIDALGAVFRRILDLTSRRYEREIAGGKMTESECWDRMRQVSRIHVPDYAELSDGMKRSLKESVQAQLLQLPLLPRDPQLRGESTWSSYMFHRLLCPFFKLTLSDRHPRRIRAAVLNGATSSPRQFVEGLTASLERLADTDEGEYGEPDDQ